MKLLVDFDRYIYIASLPKKIEELHENASGLISFNENAERVYKRQENGNLMYEEKTLEECKQSLDSLIDRLLTATGANEYILFLSDYKTFRHDIYPLYKSNRKGKIKPQFFYEIKNYAIEKYGAILIPKMEADDLVCIARSIDPDAIIASNDKDIIKCTSGHFFDTRDNVFAFTYTTPYEAAYNFAVQMLIGDKDDGVPNVRYGYGEAKAKKDLQGVGTEHLLDKVLEVYIRELGECEGINQFSLKYNLLKMIDNVNELKNYDRMD